jgi:Domain of unknown function (DUF4349)
MNATARARTLRRPLRATTLIIAAAISGTGLLLAGCSNGAPGAASSHPAQRSFAGEAAPAAPTAGAGAGARAGLPAATQATLLVPNSQSLIKTASLTVQAKDVSRAARQAVTIAQAAGGYTANEQESLKPGNHALAVVSLQLKIPVAQYDAALGQLSALGTPTSLTRQAQDVTQQVADVSSRVTSAQVAITQLRALLRRAGSVTSLLGVQDQINAEESSLEALIAQQQALAHETTFGTISLQLVGHHPKAVKAKKKKHGFVAGLSAGWHALRLVVSGLLTGLGAALPFALIAALGGGIAYGGRRRVLRRRSRPTAAQ